MTSKIKAMSLFLAAIITSGVFFFADTRVGFQKTSTFSFGSDFSGEKACSKTWAKGGRTNFFDRTLLEDAAADARVKRLFSLLVSLVWLKEEAGLGDNTFRLLLDRLSRFLGLDADPTENPTLGVDSRRDFDDRVTLLE